MLKGTKKELSGETNNSSKTLSNEESLSPKPSSTDKYSIKKAAVQYAAKGLAVIPISPTSKRPMMKFANRPPMRVDEVEEFWSKHPNANVALRTIDFFVIDVDRHGDVDGMEAIKEINHKEWFNDTLIEETAHGGIHIYFMKPTDSKGMPMNYKQIIGWRKGIDIKYDKNNYVVVSPSVLDGKHYKWINKNPIKSAPKPLIDLIFNNQSSYNDITPHYTNYTAGKSNFSSRKGEFLHMVAYGLGDKGSRNDNLTKLFGWLLAYNNDIEAAMQLAIEANRKTADPLPDHEVNSTINSILTSELSKRKER